MSDTLTPVDELRALLEASKSDPSSVDHWQLRAERIDHYSTAQKIVSASQGRNRQASEQRELDRADEAINLIDKTIINCDKRNVEAAALRLKHLPMLYSDNAGGRGDDVGAQLRNAIQEVQNGRAQAFVDFPETRALSDSGQGSYQVNTLMGNPVSALAAHSVVMSLPGVNLMSVSTGDRLRIPRYNAVTVGGIAEAGTITAAASDLDAVDVVFQKFGSYELLSTELEEDATPPILSLLGERMLKDLAARVDSGLLQGNGASDIVGLFSQSGVSTTSVAGVPTIAKAQEAEFQLLNNDGSPTAWIMAPRSWIGTNGFRRIVTGVASSIQPVLTQDPSQSVNTMSGFPVFLSSAISTTTGATSVGSIAALVDARQIVVVTRRPARLEVSRDVAFSTDQVAIRATTRVGLGVIDPAGGISLLTDIRTS